MGGHGLGGVYDHINYFGSHMYTCMKEICLRLLKAWGPLSERAWREHQVVVVCEYHSLDNYHKPIVLVRQALLTNMYTYYYYSNSQF